MSELFLDDDLDTYIINHILMPYPKIQVVAKKFNLSLSKVNEIFYNVKGERLFQYCNRVKFKVTKELIVSEKDISQVVSKTKFLNTRSLYRFFVKREGMTVRRYKLRRCNSL